MWFYLLVLVLFRLNVILFTWVKGMVWIFGTFMVQFFMFFFLASHSKGNLHSVCRCRLFGYLVPILHTNAIVWQHIYDSEAMGISIWRFFPSLSGTWSCALWNALCYSASVFCILHVDNGYEICDVTCSLFLSFYGSHGNGWFSICDALDNLYCNKGMIM